MCTMKIQNKFKDVIAFIYTFNLQEHSNGYIIFKTNNK